MTASRYRAGCQRYALIAIDAAIAAHSSAVAARALPGWSADNSLILAGGSRSGIPLLVLCGCTTTGFLEMSSVGFSARRNVTIWLIWPRGGIGALRRYCGKGHFST